MSKKQVESHSILESIERDEKPYDKHNKHRAIGTTRNNSYEKTHQDFNQLEELRSEIHQTNHDAVNRDLVLTNQKQFPYINWACRMANWLMYCELAYGELAHMANRLWRIGIWRKGIWRKHVLSSTDITFRS